MYLFELWPTSPITFFAEALCRFRALVLAISIPAFKATSSAFARLMRSVTASCICLYSSCSRARFARRTLISLTLMSLRFFWSMSRLRCLSRASRSRPACCSACALASFISALACRNCLFVEISLSSLFRRSSSSLFCFFLCAIFSATSSMQASRYACCFSSASRFFCLMTSCLCLLSSLAMSRMRESISAFSASSCCFSSFFSSCRSRLSSTSFLCLASSSLKRSRSSASDISSSKPCEGCSAGSKGLNRSTGTFSRARICLMRSFRLSISNSSSRRLRSNSCSFSLRMFSACWSRAFCTSACAWATSSRSSMV
mmetsp:Transcript_126338/g.218923  ORF Transcript_126338/g.218923 Transcript_126338/m.218923 type:complete len:315 (-) Transcript_126338:1335-2279(-)